MPKSRYVHINTGKEFELDDAFAARLTGFKAVTQPEEKAPAAASQTKRKATKPNSSKEGNK